MEINMEQQCDNPSCKIKIRKLEEELYRIRSVGFDMIKQRGLWQGTGMEPTDYSLEFDGIFANEAEYMIDILNKSMSEDQARQLLCGAFQDIYQSCKRRILKRMTDTLARILCVPDEVDSDEELYDICRAYGLLLHASGIVEKPEHETASQEICTEILQSSEICLPESELREFSSKVSKLSWNLLSTIPPLISATVDTSYYREWHEKELSPVWNENLKHYKLTYYRPILFLGYEGEVAKKGWVGNCENKGNSVESDSNKFEDLSQSSVSNSYSKSCELTKSRKMPKVKKSKTKVVSSHSQDPTESCCSEQETVATKYFAQPAYYTTKKEQWKKEDHFKHKKTSADLQLEWMSSRKR